MHFNSVLRDIPHRKNTKLWPINSYKQQNIRVLFIHAKNFNRDTFPVYETWHNRNYYFICALFWLSVFILYLLRRRIGLRMKSFLDGYFEIVAICLGGRVIRYHHRYERMFFAILMVAAFFLVALHSSHFSMHVILRQETFKVDSFETLAKHNVSFGLLKTLSYEEEYITNLLRYVVIIIIK